MPVTTATMATQIGLLQSRDFIASVMDDLNLFNDPEFNPALHGRGRRPGATVAAGFLQPLEQLLSRLPNEWLIATGLASQPAAGAGERGAGADARDGDPQVPPACRLRQRWRILSDHDLLHLARPATRRR